MDNCQIFTPDHIVELMLDQLGYCDINIIDKTIFEPSFGDGAFLTAIVNRVLQYSLKHNLSNDDICNILNNIYGVEIDEKYYKITLEKLNNMLSIYGIKYGWPNLICGDTLKHAPQIKFDLCVANPPYKKILHIDQDTRKEIETNYKFGIGNTDLYVVFFEYCLKFIKESGKLCFITPNSYFKNNSQASFRQYLVGNNMVDKIIDYGNVKVFPSADTYTAIILLDLKRNKNKTEYIMMRDMTNIEFTTSVDMSNFIDKPWSFANPTDAAFLKNILNRELKLKDLCYIQHGISTNSDKIYVIGHDIAAPLDKELLRPVIKGSTLNNTKQIIFPYKWNVEKQRYQIVNEAELKERYSATYQYLLNYKEQLSQRNMEKTALWYQYARSQGIQNTRNRKIVLKHILSQESKTCEIIEADDNALIYSGIYIIVKDEHNYDMVKRVLLSEEFHRYLMIVGKNMSGGYRSVNAKVVKEFGIEQISRKHNGDTADDSAVLK